MQVCRKWRELSYDVPLWLEKSRQWVLDDADGISPDPSAVSLQSFIFFLSFLSLSLLFLHLSNSGYAGQELVAEVFPSAVPLVPAKCARSRRGGTTPEGREGPAGAGVSVCGS